MIQTDFYTGAKSKEEGEEEEKVPKLRNGMLLLLLKLS